MTCPQHISDAINHYVPHMEGWTTPERGIEIAERILETKAKVCVDIGVFAGRSTIAMGFAARELGDGMVYGIDPWKADYASEGESDVAGAEWWELKVDLESIHRQAMQAIWGHRLDRWVAIIRSPSQYVHQLFPVIDFLNIDGQHAEVASCRDVTLYVPRVRSGGYVTFDDSNWPQTQRALSLMDAQCDLIHDTGASRTYRKR